MFSLSLSLSLHARACVSQLSECLLIKLINSPSVCHKLYIYMSGSVLYKSVCVCVCCGCAHVCGICVCVHVHVRAGGRMILISEKRQLFRCSLLQVNVIRTIHQERKSKLGTFHITSRLILIHIYLSISHMVHLIKLGPSYLHHLSHSFFLPNNQQ